MRVQEIFYISLQQRFPNFWCDPNLSLVKISRPKPQTEYVKWKKQCLYGWFLAVTC